MEGYIKATVFLLTLGLTSSYVIQDESIGITNVRNQHIYLFQNEQCTGISQYFAESTSVQNVTASSAFISGMWQVKSCQQDTPDICNVTISIPIVTCKKLTLQDSATHQLIRYGPQDTSLPELSVFSGANFLGDSQTIPAEGVADITVTSAMSYVFSGSLNWTLYTEPNFSGDWTCIVPTDDVVSNGYGLSYALNARTPLTFRSARAGECGAPDDSNPTPNPSGASVTSQSFSSFICLIGLVSGVFFRILH